MFDFEKLTVYKRAKEFHFEIEKLLDNCKPDSVITNQLKRASLSIALNIAEGTGRFTNRDKRNFYVISRSSVFECVAICDILKDKSKLNIKEYSTLYQKAEELSKMLYALIRKLEK